MGPTSSGAKLATRLGDRELTPPRDGRASLRHPGQEQQEIGVEFNIAESTVKVHVTHILEKLRVGGRTEAINVAVQRGLVRIDPNLARRPSGKKSVLLSSFLPGLRMI